jgi:hypothetical protein
MDADAFSPAHGDGMDAGVEATQERLPDVLSKSPGPAHGLAAHGWAASAKRGGLLFWLLFSWPRKRKVTRSPKAIDRSWLCKQRHRAQGALLQVWVIDRSSL